MDPRKAELIELRSFGGLSYEATAKLLGVSTSTLVREQTLAKAWLSAQMNPDAPD